VNTKVFSTIDLKFLLVVTHFIFVRMNVKKIPSPYLKFNGDEEYYYLSEKDRAIVKTETFQEKLRSALNSLDLPYVPINERGILLNAITIAINAVPELVQFLAPIIPKLNTNRDYIKKEDKELIKDVLCNIISVLSPKGTSEIAKSNNRMQEEVELLQSKFKTVLSTPEPSDCYYALVFDGNHPIFKKCLIAAGVHTWSPLDSKKKIRFAGTKTEEDFKTSFKESWKLQRLASERLPSEFTGEQVLDLIEYNQECSPVLHEESWC